MRHLEVSKEKTKLKLKFQTLKKLYSFLEMNKEGQIMIYIILEKTWKMNKTKIKV